jgi:hypothetical protein
MPEQEQTRIRQSTGFDRLHQLEESLPSGEQIITMAYHAFPFGAAVITTSRFIVVIDDGGTKITPYSEVASFSVIEGKNKMLGGFTQTTLITRFHNGTSHTGRFGVKGPWAVEVARQLLAAQERYSISGG